MKSALRWVMVGILALSVAAMAGCSGGASSGETKSVTITSAGYDPADLVIKKGTTVVWTNKDKTVHTVSSTKSVFDSGVIQPGDKFSHTFDKPGSFLYNCSINTSMSAEVLVQR